jgi:DNA transposition AAA+ family ATPase
MEENARVISIAVRDRVEEAIARDALSQTTVARECDLSSATISQYLADNYKGNIAAVERKLAKWLSARERRNTLSAAMPEAPEFFSSPAAEKVIGALEYAQQAGDMAQIIGGPGVGKTSAAREFARRSPNCWIVTMAPDCAAVAMALNEICDALGVHPEAGRGARAMAHAIRARLRGTHGLLIIDEAQHLGLIAIEELRSLHDATQIGLAFMGSYALQARVSADKLTARTAQIMSRFGMRVSIAKPSEDDVDALLDAWHITGKRERDFLRRLAAGSGALRNLVKTIRLAGLSAAGAKEEIHLRHLEDARAALDGE